MYRSGHDDDYSIKIVYNNFPWPTPMEARALYPDSSLDELTMPPELHRAHQLNDRAVMQAYDFSVRDTTESSCVAVLMRMYQTMTEG